MTNSKPRVVVWFVSSDERYSDAAVNILDEQHNGIEIIGVTATETIYAENLPFIPLEELAQNGGGMTLYLLLARVSLTFRNLPSLQSQLTWTLTNF